MDDRQLRTAWQNRQTPDRASHLSAPLAELMKHTLGRRVKQLSPLAAVWDQVVPEDIRAHAALESFSRGTLTVMVDSAAHRFQLELLLRGGLQKLLAERFTGA